MTGKTHEVTMQNFESVVDSNSLVFLDFWAAWCGPCRIFAPIFEDLAVRNPGVFFGKVNTEVATDLAEAFQVRSIPTLMVFKKGELVFEQPGVFSPGMLDDLIHQLSES